MLKTQNDWNTFRTAVQTKLEAGEAAYGDKSFSKTPESLIEELQQECLDLAGWGFVLFTRLERAREALRSALR
jgi:hypothetical protein